MRRPRTGHPQRNAPHSSRHGFTVVHARPINICLRGSVDSSTRSARSSWRALDTAYDRNLAAADYGAQLDKLRAADPGGYPHFVKLHPDKASWMDLQDAEALPWMAGFRRNARPDRVVWKQDGVTHDRSSWLAVPPGEARGGALAIARWQGARFDIEAADKIGTLLIHLDDRMTDLDQNVSVSYQGKRLFLGTAVRTIGTMLRTLADRGDPALMFDAEIAVILSAEPK